MVIEFVTSIGSIGLVVVIEFVTSVTSITCH